MHIIEIEISENRTVKCENITAGITGENEATKLKFIIPKVYKNFYKYLDILKLDGSKTQTVVGDTENEIFYYILPYQLTCNDELVLQLVLKKENTVFKSNMFSLYFGSSIEGIQILLGDYQDTIEFLMENKTSNKETETLKTKVNNKIDRSEFYTSNEELSFQISEKVNKIDFENYKTENQLSVSNKVDKIEGKSLSTEDYTTEEKTKLQGLPSNDELNITLDNKADKSIAENLQNQIDEMGIDVSANATDILNLQTQIGDIETALDNIIEIQETLIGGGSE